MTTQIPTLTDSELADIKEKLYAHYYKIEQKQYTKEKEIFESAKIIDPKHYDFSYIKHGVNVVVDVKQNDIPSLIEIVSKIDAAEDYPRTTATWWVVSQTDDESQFPEEETFIRAGYKKFTIVDESVIAGRVKNYTDHTLWDIKHNYTKTAGILEKIGYKGHADLLRQSAEEKRIERDAANLAAIERRNRPYISKSDVIKLVLIRDLLVRHDIRDGRRMFIAEDFGKHSIPRDDARQYIVDKTDGLIADLDSIARHLDYHSGGDSVFFIGPTIEAVDNFIGPVAAADSGDFGKTILEGVEQARKHIFPSEANITTGCEFLKERGEDVGIDGLYDDLLDVQSSKTLADAVKEVQSTNQKSNEPKL